jgi:NADH-quinone oxidoreductase subunit J
LSTVDLLFYFFASLSVGGGLLMVMSRHPVPAALFMIISLVSVAALFVLLEAFFLAILQVLVYAGAVMVLFLFIIMLLDVGPEGGKASRLKLISGLAGALTVSILMILLLQVSGIGNEELAGWEPIQTDQLVQGDSLVYSTSLKNFGFGLFTKYMLPLQIAGFLLLAAMVGVIVLSKKSLPTEDSN